MEDVARSSNVKEGVYYASYFYYCIMTAVGKLILGILADFKWINTLYLYVATLIIIGLALCADFHLPKVMLRWHYFLGS